MRAWPLPAQILKEDDANWPPPDKVGRQELEIIMGETHISFTTTKLGSLMQVQQSKDPDGLRIFYYLVQVTTAVLANCMRFSYTYASVGRNFVNLMGVLTGSEVHGLLPDCCSLQDPAHSEVELPQKAAIFARVPNVVGRMGSAVRITQH